VAKRKGDFGNECNVLVFEGEKKMTFRIATHEWEDKVKMDLEDIAYNDSADSTLPGSSNSQLQGLSMRS
jgi:hypothetical protein